MVVRVCVHVCVSTFILMESFHVSPCQPMTPQFSSSEQPLATTGTAQNTDPR